jgi:hypothetical protein
MFFSRAKFEADECTTDQVVLFPASLLAYSLVKFIESVSLVAFLTPGRTVLDASALVAMFSGLLDALRANSAVLVQGDHPFVGFAESSVRGTEVSVNKQYLATEVGEVRTRRHSCTCRCSTSQSCTTHTSSIRPQSVRCLRYRNSPCICLSLWAPP